VTILDHEPAGVSPPAHASVDPHHARRWLILAVLGMAQFLVVLDVTVINVALPSAQASLHFSDADRQWIVTAYALAFGSLLPLGGRLSDLLGRKWTFIGGAAGFAIASAIGGAAPSFGVLVAARAGQGVFAALIAPAALSLLNVTFTDKKERDKAIAVFAGIAGTGGALGLIIGGALTDYASWRYAMFVNILGAAVAIFGALRLFTNQGRSKHLRLDIPGTLTVSSGLFAIVFGFANAETSDWGAPLTVASLVAGVVLLAAFIALQQRVEHPLIPLRILSERSRGGSFLVIAATGIVLFTIFLFLSYFLQGNLHYSPIRTGLAVLPLFGVFFPVAGIGQALVPKLDLRLVYLTGLLIAAAGLLLLAQLNADSNYLTGVLPGIMLVPLGLGFAGPAAYGYATVGLRDEDSGAAGAMVDVSQQVAAAMSIALLSTFAAHATSSYIHDRTHTAHVLAQATVHGESVAFYCAAAIVAALAVVTTALVAPHGPPTTTEPVPV
jgi:EmrB/QacA subfamily drug resistance transporter